MVEMRAIHFKCHHKREKAKKKSIKYIFIRRVDRQVSDEATAAGAETEPTTPSSTDDVLSLKNPQKILHLIYFTLILSDTRGGDAGTREHTRIWATRLMAIVGRAS